MEFKQRLSSFLGEDWTDVAGRMRAALHSDIRLLNEANESILSHNGKMLRPAMALLFARACAGTVSEEGHKVAAAAELLHNATLLHDDVADRSDQRRGAPTASSVQTARDRQESPILPSRRRFCRLLPISADRRWSNRQKRVAA